MWRGVVWVVRTTLPRDSPPAGQPFRQTALRRTALTKIGKKTVGWGNQYSPYLCEGGLAEGRRGLHRNTAHVRLNRPSCGGLDRLWPILVFQCFGPRTPLLPRTHDLLHAARWWPRASRRRPHRQERTDRGKGKRRRRSDKTRNCSASNRVTRFVGIAVKSTDTTDHSVI